MNQYNSSENNSLNDEEFDQFFKTELENHEVIPDPSNWEQIRHGGFFYQILQLSKTKSFKVAASLVFILSIFSVLSQLNLNVDSTSLAEVEIPAPVVIESIPEVLEVMPLPKKNDFVLDIIEKKEDIIKKEKLEKQMDEYLAFLLEDENEFADQIDSLEILKYLQPVEQLPLDEMFAVIPDMDDFEEIIILAPHETVITLPHRFVEDQQQIETYLEIYEINQTINSLQ